MASAPATASSEVTPAGRVPPLHVVTDDAVLASPRFVERATEVLRAGRDGLALHLRGPRTSGRALHGLACALVPVAREAGALLLVNDRLDVALVCGADGVQLGARGIAAEDARRLIGAGPLLGCSVHSLAGAAAAARHADFLLVGTIYASRSHPGRPPAGAALLRSLAGTGPALVAIGGVTAAKLPEVRAAGAWGAAVLRAVWEAGSPAAAVEELLNVWQETGR